MTARFWIVVFLFFPTACREQPTPTPTAPSASAPSAPSDPAPPAPPPAKSYPPELNLAEATRKLDCGKGRTKKACEILAEFAKSNRFTGQTPSGESRWLGRAYVVEKGTERDEYLLLHCHGVPTAKVGPSSLPLMISTSPLPIEVQVEAKRMWTSLSHGRHRANRRNLAFRFIEKYEPKAERGAINTTGTSVQLIGELSENIGFLRQPELKRLLMVQPSRQMEAQPGDGTYAEFWQATW